MSAQLSCSVCQRRPAAASGAAADPLMGIDQLVEPRGALLPPAVQCVGTHRSGGYRSGRPRQPWLLFTDVGMDAS